MTILPDTNVILRAFQTGHPQQAIASNAISTLLANGDDVVLVPQNVYEFWAVATRPTAVNGLGLSFQTVEQEIVNLRFLLRFLPDESGIYPRWYQLVTTFQVSGKPSHDARLVAAMYHHGVSHILTFNGGDFARYPGITVLDPATV